METIVELVGKLIEHVCVVSNPSEQNQSVINDQTGVITARETTPGSIAENKELMDLVGQHEKNTHCQVRTVVADHKYDTNENYVACQERGIVRHMGDALGKAEARERTIFGDEVFVYDPVNDLYCCHGWASAKAASNIGGPQDFIATPFQELVAQIATGMLRIQIGKVSPST